jgi:hypothetical protein
MTRQTNSTRILTALSAANDAILRVASRKELHQRVCDAIVEGSALVAASIFEAEADGRLGCVAGAGNKIEMFRRPETLTDPTSAGTQDLMTLAFHSGLSCIADDIQSDERVRAWREMGMLAGIGAVAAVPIAGNGSVVRIFLVFLQTRVHLMTRWFCEWNAWPRMFHLSRINWNARTKGTV